MLRLLEGREPARPCRVGTAEQGDVAIAPFLRGYPLDGVVAVGALVVVRDELTVGVATAPHVLRDEGEVPRRPFAGELAERLAVLPVRGPADDRGPRPVSGRHMDVGRQSHAVPHRNHVVVALHHGTSLASGRHQASWSYPTCAGP